MLRPFSAESRIADCHQPPVLCVLADFFFALFPWLFLWQLQMNQREKMVIAISLSLGLLYVPPTIWPFSCSF